MKKIVLILSLAAMVAILPSCSDDGTGGSNNTSTGLLSDSDKDKLYDKVWYSTNSAGGIEHEFMSDGTLRLSLSLDGRWTWVNNGDTMGIVDASSSRFKYVFLSITDSEMQFKQSVDGYKDIYTFRDTE